MTEIGEFLMAFGDYLIWFGLISLVFAVTVDLLKVWLRHKVAQHIDQKFAGISLALDQQLLIALTVEIDHNQYLCYNYMTKDFVCQGSDLAEIRQRFRERYPDKDAAIYDGDESAVATLKSQLKELQKQNENSIGI